MFVFSSPFILVWRRARSNWRYLLVVFAGVLLATTLLAAAPMYLSTINELGLRHSLKYEKAGALDAAITVPYRPLDQEGFSAAQSKVEGRVNESIGPLVRKEVTHIRSSNFDLSLPGLALPSGVPGPKAVLQSFNDLNAHVEVVQGSPLGGSSAAGPGPPAVDVLVGRQAAQVFGLNVGESLTLLPYPDDPSRKVLARVSGIVEPVDPNDDYWYYVPNPFAAQTDYSADGDIPILPLFTSQDSLFQNVAPAFPGILADYWWYFFIDSSRIHAPAVPSTLSEIRTLETRVGADLPGSAVFSGLEKTLTSYEQKVFFSRIPLLLLSIMVLALVLYYLSMVASVVIERQLSETALLRSRGARTEQVVAMYAWESVLIAALAFLVGPFLGLLATGLLGLAPPLRPLSGGGLLSVHLSGSAFLMALVGAVLCFVALLLPALRGGYSLVQHKASSARPTSSMLLHTYYIDVLFIVIAGFLYWELTRRGSAVTGTIAGSSGTDYLLLAAPPLFMVAIALLVLRLFGPLVRALGWFASRSRRAWLVLGMWHLGRDPVHYVRPILLLVLAAGLAAFAGSFSSTMERSYRERTLYSTGSDMRIAGIPSELSGGREALVGQFKSIEGVNTVSGVYRDSGQLGAGDNGQGFTVLAVDPMTFADVSWYRGDFSERPLFTLMQELQKGRAMLRGMDLPDGAQKIGIWVKPADSYTNMSLWMMVRDAQGRDWRYRLGRLDFDGWRYLEASLVDSSGSGPEGPLTLREVYVWEFDYPDGRFPPDLLVSGYTSSGQVNFNDLTVSTVQDPNGKVLDSFAVMNNWSVLAASALMSDVLQSSNKVTYNGQPTAELSWKATPSSGIRGLIPSMYHDPLPVVASRSLLSATGKNPGDTIDVSISSIRMPVQIVDAAELFPTLDPGQPFVIANVDTLTYYMSLFRNGGEVFPNEVWFSLSQDPAKRAQAATRIDTGGRQFFGDVVNRDEALKTLEADPLATVGGRGLVLAAFIVLVIVSVGGYVSYFYVASYRRPAEFAVLRALGVTAKQQLAQVALVHSMVITIGVLLGAWVGSRVQVVMMAFLEHTERGRAVIPPFAGMSDWTGVAVIVVASAVMLAGIVAWLVTAFLHTDVYRVLRKGEE